MNKSEYLNKLTNELGHMPYGDVKDIIQSMEEHFDEGVSEGRSEEEIAASLGDPAELAAEFKDGAKFKQVMKRRKLSDNFKGPDGRSRIFVILFNIFLGVECWLILLAAIFAAFILVDIPPVPRLVPAPPATRSISGVISSTTCIGLASGFERGSSS